MNRRIFLRNTLSASILSSLMVDNPLGAFALQVSERQSGYEGRSLVLVQLEGGNDGLNTVIPLDQYAKLTKARKNLIIPDKKVLPLSDSAITGLHPSLTDIQKLYNNRNLTILQGVGCANPDLSHFKAIDIWHTGYDLSSTIPTGWVGRYLDQEHSARTGDPPAIQIGTSLSKALQGQSSSVGMIVRNTSYFYDLVPGGYDPAAKTPAGNQLSFLRTTIEESKEYLIKVKAAALAQKNLSSLYPSAGENSLADQLRIVAQLVGGGLQTKVYIVNIKGFDTHDEQVDSSDTTQGGHADLLAQVSRAVAAFEDDLTLMGKQDKVLGMIYSEFGRRIKSNAGYGCDHGTSAPVMLFGSKLKGGIVGHNPIIGDNVGVNDNLLTQIDFRSVYASILNGWFGASKSTIESTLMANYPVLDIFKA